MELYYTEKERHIHKFLLTKGWTDEEINKSMFNLTKWTMIMDTPIEAYYALIMKEGNYANYKEYLNRIEKNGINPEGYLRVKKAYRQSKFIAILTLSFLAAYLFILLIRP